MSTATQRALQPFEGLRVMEVGRGMTASFGARLLADLGAEVIKVEPPEGDPARARLPGLDVDAALFGYLNAGKRSITLDLMHPHDTDVLRQLAGSSDILIVSIDWDGGGDLPPFLFDPSWTARPTTVSVSPLGRFGVRANEPSSPFVVQHSAGFAYHQACPVREPGATSPVACADWEAMLAAGLLVPTAALWGLSRASQSSTKPFIDFSIEDLLAYLLVEPFAEWQLDSTKAVERQRAPDAPTTVAGGLIWMLRCADGAVLVSPREDHQWARWTDVMGQPAWAVDPATCATKDLRAANAAALQSKMQDWSSCLPADEVVQRAQASKVACFRVSTADDLLHNRQLNDRLFFNRFALTEALEVNVPGLPFRMKSTGGRELKRGRRVVAPGLGEANGTLQAVDEEPATQPFRRGAVQ